MRKLVLPIRDKMTRLRGLRTRRRDRRVAALGGLPYSSEPVKVTGYVPSLREEERVAMIEQYVARLMPEAVDEATGYPLDNLINAMADLWLLDVDEQYSRFRSEATLRLGEAQAVSEQYSVLHSYDRRRLDEVERALETVLSQVTETHGERGR
ncbi:hypothetical protein [Sphaerisporangium sp. TRM90804]|uniref:hypothetical protein n=1 Tax=Sphaerisporangium sp. TRM90804 TaxID=3031113 RepID=UPI00244A1944|nr:hypothetical protein [Sphaerisporangium sp. TRM90804]MDH2430329.1 hypothetical protein [Sphaerisporangium sp. TRM90804]